MIVGPCFFNPTKDKCSVSQTGFVELKSAMVNNTIPPQIGEGETEYNGIEDPSSILGKPRDVFEALDMQKHISEFVSSSTNDTDEHE